MQHILGIELGSTRIKSILTDENGNVLAQGTHEWENTYSDGQWTYSLEEVKDGLRASYAKLIKNYGKPLENLAAAGVSAMMHGYLAFDESWNLLVPFRTWRNTNTATAAEELTQLFNFNIPLRWSVAHYYQAILNKEKHIDKVAHLTTLAGYVHYKLTGKNVLGVGDASGMFPVEGREYNRVFAQKFKRKTGIDIIKLLPEIKVAGEPAGRLTEEGARFLDPAGILKGGAHMCPPEGDAGTGMVATNSIRPRTGNVSAGTSVFAMIVLEKELSKPYPEIDLVTTPVGDLVGMVHCNNCTSDLNAWVDLFGEFAQLAGLDIPKWKLYDLLYYNSENGDKDCGGLLAYNYVSNEHITEVEEGRPLFVRTSESKMNLANFMRSHLFAALGALKVGCDIMLKEEGVRLDAITGHGGLFKTAHVGQSYLAAAIGAPVTVMKTAGEGGAWGIAILANYSVRKKDGQPLAGYLDEEVFRGMEGVTLAPDPADVAGFEAFAKRYVAGLPVVREAVRCMKE